MQVAIRPSRINGTVPVPSSKSMAHRAILCASLSQGISTITNIQMNNDVRATINCMEELGARIQFMNDALLIQGTDVRTIDHPVSLPCNESGSTMRFILPLASLSGQPVSLRGEGRLLKRPMGVYRQLYENQNLSFSQSEEAIAVQGALQAEEIELPGDVSSQFISGLLLACPLMEKTSTIHIQPPFESKSYVDMTLSVLQDFGIRIKQPDDYTYVIPGNQTYKAKDVRIEGDYSQMAFFGVLAAIKETLTCTGCIPNSLQGDAVILDILKEAGAVLSQDDDSIVIHPNLLKPISVDLSNCPDLGPILCVLASYIPGKNVIYNAGRLRLKESDRIAAMETELKKWDVDITTTEDTITIHGKESYSQVLPVLIDSHNDHRIAMAMAIFGLCAQSPSRIFQAEAVDKSFPNFFSVLETIQIK